MRYYRHEKQQTPERVEGNATEDEYNSKVSTTFILGVLGVWYLG